jgi:hypothetical protein
LLFPRHPTYARPTAQRRFGRVSNGGSGSGRVASGAGAARGFIDNVLGHVKLLGQAGIGADQPRRGAFLDNL